MAVDVDIKPLAELLDGGFSKSAIRRAFSRFSCGRDPDVSLFPKAHAIQNEGTGVTLIPNRCRENCTRYPTGEAVQPPASEIV